MSKGTWVVLITILSLLLSVTCMGQEGNTKADVKARVYGGYMYAHYDDNAGNTNGWTMSGAGKVYKYFMAEGQMTGEYTGKTSTSIYSVYAGPRLQSSKDLKVSPFFHWLFGAGWSSAPGTKKEFSSLLGAGIDVKLNKSMSWRGEFDRVVFGKDGSLAGTKVSTGVVFAF